MHLNFSCPAVSQLCSGRERKENRGGILSDYRDRSQQASETVGSRPRAQANHAGISAYDGDLHLQAVGDPSDLKALDFKVHPDGGLIVTVKNILAKPAGAKEVIREAARMLHSRQQRSGGNEKSTHWEPHRRWSMKTDQNAWTMKTM